MYVTIKFLGVIPYRQMSLSWEGIRQLPRPNYYNKRSGVISEKCKKNKTINNVQVYNGKGK